MRSIFNLSQITVLDNYKVSMCFADDEVLFDVSMWLSYVMRLFGRFSLVLTIRLKINTE